VDTEEEMDLGVLESLLTPRDYLTLVGLEFLDCDQHGDKFPVDRMDLPEYGTLTCKEFRALYQ
jgi:hypothetical protein